MTVTATTRSLPVTGATDAEQQRINEAIDVLASTQHGSAVAAHLLSGDVRFEVVDDTEYWRRHPGSGAVYEPRTDTIVMPRSSVNHPGFVTVLAHEGQHAVDDARAGHWLLQAFGTFGGSIADAALGTLRLRNPLTEFSDGIEQRNHGFEVSAYELQARVAHELGWNESNWSPGQEADGTPASPEAIRERLRRTPLYQLSEQRRTVGSAMVGALMVTLGAPVTAAIGHRLLPKGSFLASRTWPYYAAATAVTGALFVGDRLRTRQPAADG